MYFPNVQVYPNRITCTPTRNKKTLSDLVNRQLDKVSKKSLNLSYQTNFKKIGNPFVLSSASKRKLMDSINSMFVLSPGRRIDMQNGKSIFNFRLNFVTLTLPSAQMHDDVFIKKEFLNQFLTEIRKHYNVKNFVWKAELQKNENIHFHLITDQYLDYQAIRRRWNRILNKHGYIDAYRSKFENLNLTQYNNLVNKEGKTDFKTIAQRYAKGKKSNWSNPNSVDVRSVSNKKDLAIYLAKYVAKNVADSDQDEETTERQKKFGRSWSRSYSLAQLKYVHKLDKNDVLELLHYLSKDTKNVKKFVGDWFQVFYFNIQTLHKNVRSWIEFYVKANAKIYNYPFVKLKTTPDVASA